MSDIESTAQLIDAAELRDVVIHELLASRDATGLALNLPAEELHAPDSPNDDAAVSFCTRLEDDTLGVRCRIETCNAYGRFVAEGEAIFYLPAPVSAGRADIVEGFIEQAGALTVYPYVRSAVASLAAQLSVPATPLPVLRPSEMDLTPDDEPLTEAASTEPFMHGTFRRTTDDGEEVIGEFFVDEETGLLTRLGAEGETPDEDELLNAWAQVPPPGELTWVSMVREHGEAAIRQAVEDLRPTNGDASTDATLVEIDEVVAHIAVEDALTALDESVTNLKLEIETSRGSQESNVSTALLDCAESVRDSWDRVKGSLLT